MARLGRSFPNNFWLRPATRSHVLITASQPALGLAKLGVTAAQPVFLPAKLGSVAAQTAFVRAVGSNVIQQPLYVGGPVLPRTGSLPSFAYGLATLSGLQAAHAAVRTTFLASIPLYAAGSAQAFLAAQPAYGVVRSSLTGAQSAYGVVRKQMIGAQPAFAPVGAIAATQGMMVRSFPDLTVTPNVVRQQYKPVQAIEIYTGPSVIAQYGESQYGDSSYGDN